MTTARSVPVFTRTRRIAPEPARGRKWARKKRPHGGG
jgi:hypothetical protein